MRGWVSGAAWCMHSRTHVPRKQRVQWQGAWDAKEGSGTGVRCHSRTSHWCTRCLLLGALPETLTEELGLNRGKRLGMHLAEGQRAGAVGALVLHARRSARLIAEQHPRFPEQLHRDELVCRQFLQSVPKRRSAAVTTGSNLPASKQVCCGLLKVKQQGHGVPSVICGLCAIKDPKLFI